MSGPSYREKFHGRVRGREQICAAPGCREAGEFRAPCAQGGSGWQWFCLDHVREFNQRYNYFTGMSREEIEEAQLPHGGWDREVRAFSRAGVDAAPRWRDFNDPLDAISARFRDRMADAAPAARADGRALSPLDRAALKTLGLPIDADRRALRTRYSELVRKYHPDRNGGDRSFETSLRGVIDAYQHLRGAAAFA